MKLLASMKSVAPEVVVLENVTGLATSHGGDDLRAAIRALNKLDYSMDILAIDARRFLPQSRPRMFLVGAKTPPGSTSASSELRPDWAENFYGDPTLLMHRAPLPNPPGFVTSGWESASRRCRWTISAGGTRHGPRRSSDHCPRFSWSG